jgi:hypothetical protein
MPSCSVTMRDRAFAPCDRVHIGSTCCGRVDRCARRRRGAVRTRRMHGQDGLTFGSGSLVPSSGVSRVATDMSSAKAPAAPRSMSAAAPRRCRPDGSSPASERARREGAPRPGRWENGGGGQGRGGPRSDRRPMARASHRIPSLLLGLTVVKASTSPEKASRHHGTPGMASGASGIRPGAARNVQRARTPPRASCCREDSALVL